MTGPSAFNWLAAQIVAEAQDAIIFANTQGIINLWNKGAEHIFGYQAEEALGQSLDLIIPERWRKRHWQGYRQVMASGVTQYGRQLLAVPGKRKDNRPLSLEFSIVLIRGEDGQVAGAAAILRDVTAGWQQEKELKERLARLEAQQSTERQQ
ncbi:MAG: PAS domain S-box protein [Desulfobacca sp.]|nr:PAS domain S-box protein [Desulfobacca sp.]